MNRVVSNIFAYLNGFRFQVFIRLFRRNSRFGKACRIFKGSELRIRRECKAAIDDNVKIDPNTFISVLKKGKLYIGNSVGIGRNDIIVCHDSITIGEGTTIAPYVCIYDHDHKFDSVCGVNKTEYATSPIIIGKNCWIGAGTIILKGTIIGDNCVIGAGAIIKGVYERNSIIIQRRNTEIKEIK